MLKCLKNNNLKNLYKINVKQPKKRLGYKNINEIKDHQFFNDIEWKKVENKQYSPIFVPNLRDSNDLNYFDNVFFFYFFFLK